MAVITPFSLNLEIVLERITRCNYYHVNIISPSLPNNVVTTTFAFFDVHFTIRPSWLHLIIIIIIQYLPLCSVTRPQLACSSRCLLNYNFKWTDWLVCCTLSSSGCNNKTTTTTGDTRTRLKWDGVDLPLIDLSIKQNQKWWQDFCLLRLLLL